MKALIFGVTGQDGYYLAEHLLASGHDVHGVIRRPKAWPLGVRLHPGDLLDQASVEDVLLAVRPDEVYNLAAVTSPGGAWGSADPPLLAEVTAVGAHRLLAAVAKAAPEARVVHASSSAIYDPHRYGLYGISKRFAHDAVIGARSAGLHASNAVLFSHASPRQDPRFLARRITSTIARIANGSREHLTLGDVESRRDWGYAPDYVQALPLIARQGVAGDHVIATGVTHSVRELTECALAAAGLTWQQVVRINPAEPRVPDEQVGNAQEDRLAAQRILDWKPATGFADMVELMVRAEVGG